MQREYVGTGKRPSFSWGHRQTPRCCRLGPLGPVGGGGKRERRTPYLLLIRHPILEVGHLGCSGPARRPARGRPGRKLSGGITKGAVGRTRPEAPAKRAPCQFRAGGTAWSGSALGSRLCPRGLGVFNQFLPEFRSFPRFVLGARGPVPTARGARAPSDRAAVAATPRSFPGPAGPRGSRVQCAKSCSALGNNSTSPAPDRGEG